MKTLVKEVISPQSGGYDKARPFLNRIFKNLGLDKNYIKASGNYLSSIDNDGLEKEVLDFINGYGSLLLGHNHPTISSHAIQLLQQKIPIHSQLSPKSNVGKLATELSERIGKYTGKAYITTFANTGAEAVEAAIKHARFHFSNRLHVFTDRLHQQLHIINNHLSKNRVEAPLLIGEKSFKDFGKFKAYYIQRNQEIIDKIHPVLLSAEKGFHGKTTGALAITSNRKFRKDFDHHSEISENVRFFKHEIQEVKEIIERSRVTLVLPIIDTQGNLVEKQVSFLSCSGIIVEPIQGEAGVLPIEKTFLQFLREITLKEGIPLIFDEIQCGFYRTGSLLYSTRLEVEADYYLLGKALGGGMVKNAALIIEKPKYIEAFGLLHTSTFAEDEFSASISLKALQVSERHAAFIPEIASYFKYKLDFLKSKFPEVVRDVRGTGLMWALEFFDLNLSSSYCFQMFSRTGYLNYLFSSYLLNRWNIRVAPTLSNPQTLRLQPSVLTTKAQIDALYHALEALCEIVYCRDFYKLIEHLLPNEEQGAREVRDFGRTNVPVEVDNTHESVGFITHFINEDGARQADESIAHLSDETINELLDNASEIAAPMLTSAKLITSKNGKKVNTYFAGLLFTANMARKMMLENKTKDYVALCERAVDMLDKEYGCKLVGLGQYTSVITKNGKTICNPNVAITTGNSFTVGIGVQAVMSEVLNSKIYQDSLTLGVLGAGGNISSTYIKSFLPHCTKILFKGSDSEKGKVRTLRYMRELVSYVFKEVLADSSQLHPVLDKKLRDTEVFQKISKGKLKLNDGRLCEMLEQELREEMPFKILDSLYGLQACHMTVVATNSPKAFLYSKYFAPYSIVYDISVPINCSNELINNNKHIKVLLGGVVQLPNNERLSMKSYPLGKGEAFACISETVLLGLEGNFTNFSFGHLSLSQVTEINQIGKKHGFHFKKPKIEQIF